MIETNTSYNWGNHSTNCITMTQQEPKQPPKIVGYGLIVLLILITIASYCSSYKTIYYPYIGKS